MAVPPLQDILWGKKTPFRPYIYYPQPKTPTSISKNNILPPYFFLSQPDRHKHSKGVLTLKYHDRTKCWHQFQPLILLYSSLSQIYNKFVAYALTSSLRLKSLLGRQSVPNTTMSRRLQAKLTIFLADFDHPPPDPRGSRSQDDGTPR